MQESSIPLSSTQSTAPQVRSMKRASKIYSSSTSIPDELIFGNLILLVPVILGLLIEYPFRDSTGLLQIVVLFCYFSGLLLVAIVVSRLLSRWLGWRYSSLLTWPIWFCLLFMTVGYCANISTHAFYWDREDHFVHEQIYLLRRFLPKFGCLLMVIGIIVNPVWLGDQRKS